MSSISPESLVQTWLGENSAATHAAIFNHPLYVPYDQLTGIDGWVVWLGHPPVPDWATLLPAPEELLWGDPSSAIAITMMVAADYAVRRGATDSTAARVILLRESPLVVIVPSEIHRSVEPLLQQIEASGIPTIRIVPKSAEDLSAMVPPFSFRSTVHAADLGRPHDPARSFEEFSAVESIGGNSLSSYVVHNEGERDEVTITGDVSARIGIEIGLGGAIPIEETVSLEQIVASIPSFLTGVTSHRKGNSLKIGWRDSDAPLPEEIGEAFRLYLKVMLGIPLVDVRIAFAPPKGRSALLTDMRARAAAFRTYRSAVIAGDPDPLQAVESNRSSESD